jgi:hypothetical protein
MALAAFWIRSYPGGPLMFGLQHPRVAVVVTATFFGLGGAFLVAESLRDLSPEAEPVFRGYLIQTGTLGFGCGLLYALIGVVRGPRNPRQAAANFSKTMRLLGSGYWWIGTGLVALVVVGAEWFSPVPSARFGRAGIVAFLGFVAPVLVVQAARVFLFPSTVPSVRGVAAAFAEESQNGSGE